MSDWVLLGAHRRLALREERDVSGEFGAACDAHAGGTPHFLPLRELHKCASRGQAAYVEPRAREVAP